MKTLLKSAVISVAMTLCAGAIAAQESTNRVFAKTDWSVFVEQDPTQCWVVSSPKETVNSKGGRVVAVNRGDILMFVSFWPSAEKLGEVSFMGGYTFKEGTTVKLVIGDEAFELFTTGETAWALTPEDDARIIASMRRGAQAVVTGISSRDTTTQDTFSLLGFTASLEDAQNRCKH